MSKDLARFAMRAAIMLGVMLVVSGITVEGLTSPRSPAVETAAAPMVPMSLSGVTVVSVEVLQALRVKGVPLVDVRSMPDYLTVRIPGALHARYQEYSERSEVFNEKSDHPQEFVGRLADILPAGSPVIFYCNGLYCWKSYKASRLAVASGYHPVYWFRGGLSEWVEAGLPTESE